MTNMTIGSILIGSRDSERLRQWYGHALAVPVNQDGFLEFGEISVLIDPRQDIGGEASEPGRHIINFHVDDIHRAANRLHEMNATALGDIELRDDLWFATFRDPDGNMIQLIQLTALYWSARGRETEVARATVSARLPAADLVRAEEFYGKVLGLSPAERRPGGLHYRSPSGTFSLFSSTGRASGDHTQLTFTVDDIERATAELRRRGVALHDIDQPGMRTMNGVAQVQGNYPSSQSYGELAAWFNDSEGNLLSISQPLRDPATREPSLL
jgi:catechol 2,3-dioxygenase-like lactoylglutathione lyase family enzyme